MNALVGKSKLKKLVVLMTLLALSVPAMSSAQESEGGAHGGGTFMKPIETCAEAIDSVATMARLLGHADVQLNLTLRETIEQPNNKKIDKAYVKLEKATEQVQEAILFAKKICK